MTLKEFISKLNVDDETRFTIMKRNGPKMMNKREAAWNNVIHAHAHSQSVRLGFQRFSGVENLARHLRGWRNV